LIIRESKSIDSELYTIAVRCAGQIRQTNNVSGRNAIVGQFLEFPADKSVQGNIIFQLIDVGNPNKPPLEGTYPIALLADQLKHDEWVVLNRMDGLRSDARLYVTFQHIWSEAEYFKGLIGYWDTFIAQKRADIEKCKADKIKLDTPNDFLMTVAYGDFYIQRLKPTQSLGSTHGMDSAYTNEVMKNPSRTHPLASLASIFGFVLFIACLLLFWYRAAFDTVNLYQSDGNCSTIDRILLPPARFQHKILSVPSHSDLRSDSHGHYLAHSLSGSRFKLTSRNSGILLISMTTLSNLEESSRLWLSGLFSSSKHLLCSYFSDST
jgi:hypothetical protein